MNSLMDSPLEALAFNYLSVGFFTAINSLWTWVAVVTAAVSFWRIRAAGGCPKPQGPVCIDRDSNGSQPVSEVVKSDERPREAFVPAPAASSSTTRPAVIVGGGNEDVDGVTKGKFTVYYEDDSRESDNWTVMEEWESDGRRSDGWWESWEKMLKTKMGENGWYMYQDVTELNGNVVRFWDSGFGTLTRDSRYSNSCINVW